MKKCPYHGLSLVLALALLCLISTSMMRSVSAGSEDANRPHSPMAGLLSARTLRAMNLASRVEPPAPLAGLTFTVNSTADPGTGTCDAVECTLREAITAANAAAGSDTIAFNIPNSGPHTITPLTPLPSITSPVVIDGYTQPGASANTLADGDNAVLMIELNGSAAGATSLISISAGSSTVRGLVINRTSGNRAISLDTNGGNTIEGNFVGVDVAGSVVAGAALTANGNGVYIVSGSNNTIGGLTPAARNIISGQANSGVSLFGGTGHLVEGNFIGTDRTGTNDLGNAIGVNMAASDNNTIGGTAVGARNVVSGNGTGVNCQSSNNLFQGNYFGINALGGAFNYSNVSSIGISLFNGSNNTIGGATAAARNVISGHNIGISLNGTPSPTVQGNFIGTDATGTIPLGNTSMGINMQFSNNTLIGGVTAGAGNLISANGIGILLSPGTAGTVIQVQGNLIGTDVNGTADLGNMDDGINIVDVINRTTNVTIGGTNPGARNVISGNNGDGIDMRNLSGTVVQGNLIGTQIDGTSPLGNGQWGLALANAANTTIGGAVTGAGNRIAFNGAANPFGGGVLISISGNNNSVRGNSIFSNTTNGMASGGGLGIDLSGSSGGNGPTVNDSCDSDTGPNNLQNFPALTSAVSSGGTTAISGSLNSTANTAFTIDFYSNSACDPTGNGEGQTYLGSTTVTTDGSCGASINVTLPVAVPAGNIITSTATDRNGNTSEFSSCTLAAAPPSAVSATSGSGVYNGTATLRATLSSGGSALNGKTVGFTLNSMPVGNGTTDSSGVATLSGISLSGINAGTYANAVNATFAGDADFAGSSGSGTLTVSKADQTVAVGTHAPASAAYNSSFTVTATANSGLAVTYGSSGACTNSSAVFTMTASSGTCSVNYSQAGNNNYNAASQVTEAVTAQKADQSITFGALSGKTFGDPDFTLSATADSGLMVSFAAIGNCTISASTVHLTGAGSCTITASQAGDTNYNAAASVDQSFTIARANQTITFGALSGKTFGDPDFTVSATATSGLPVSFAVTGNCTISGSSVHLTGAGSCTVTASQSGDSNYNAAASVDQSFTIAAAGPTIQFAQATYNVTEDVTFTTITVNRTGDTSGAATVEYATTDGTASERSDYTTAVGTLRFAAGEASKTIDLLISEDSYPEGPETFSVVLSNPVGATLGSLATASVEISDDVSEPANNPIDDTPVFVGQHYHDFLNRQADMSGFDFWTNEINSCGLNAACVEARRLNVSAAYYLSIEFQATGFEVIRVYKATFTDTLQRPRGFPRYREFLRDAQEIGRGVVVGQGNWQQRMADNILNFAREWVQKPDVLGALPNTGANADSYVDALFLNSEAVPTASERNAAITAYGAGGVDGRARALLSVIESGSVFNRQYNSTFVLMEYLGYLRRNPDDAPDANYDGFDFWLRKLNAFSLPGEDMRDPLSALRRIERSEMVKAFISSIEYRRRFGQ